MVALGAVSQGTQPDDCVALTPSSKPCPKIKPMRLKRFREFRAKNSDLSEKLDNSLICISSWRRLNYLKTFRYTKPQFPG